MDDGGSARKKLKVRASSLPQSAIPLIPLTFSNETCEALGVEFASTLPFPHIALEGLCEDAFLKRVREEIITELKADYKETDIFKVLQTSDLSNLGESDKGVASLLQLRDAIYSKDFRSFIQRITRCPELAEQVDCSCNIYPESGHLLCHDDVIGSRCVSYIVYLTDPDLEWKESDGGALELYPIGVDGVPECVPSKRIMPKWNQMVVFCVEPDVSFHSVEEVRTAGNHRLSISGWFHTAAEHVKISKSSLNQLQDSTETPIPMFSFEPEQYGDVLKADDVSYLEKWINITYLNPENIEKVYKTFQEEGSIQLRDFLNADTLRDITATASEADARLNDHKGAAGGWSVVGPPHKLRHLKFDGKCSDDPRVHRMGVLLSQVETDVFQSGAFCRLLHQLTGLDIIGGNSDVRCFRPGSDYTIALYSRTKQETLDSVLCFVNTPDEASQSLWDFGEAGGFEAYLLADTKEQSAADVYRADDEDSGVLSVSPVHNTLNLVLSDEGLIKFVKYVSSNAPGCRWDISAEYSLSEPALDSPA